MLSIIGWIVFGLIVGAVARFLMPGNQPMGIIMTIILGIAGAFVGGFIGTTLSGEAMDMANPSGWIGAILGALLLLFIYAMAVSRRSNV